MFLYPPFNLLLNNPMNLLVLGTVEGRRPSLVGDVQGHPELCHQSPHTLSVTSLHGAHEATGEAAPEAKDGLDLHQPLQDLDLVSAGGPHEAHTHLLAGQPGEPALARLQVLLNTLQVSKLNTNKTDRS